jgi:Uma2 family endonuclease
MGYPQSLATTVHDYMRMPQGPPYYQLIDGELHMSPSPSWRHQDIAGNIYATIKGFLRKNDIGRVFIAPLDVCLTEINVFQPDVLYFSHERGKILGERCVEGAPDLVIEILSESTAHLDKGHKRKVYARTGVKELWFVDPDLREIETFQLKTSGDTPVATYSGKDKFRSPLLPGLKFSCSEIFGSQMV